MDGLILAHVPIYEHHKPVPDLDENLCNIFRLRYHQVTPSLKNFFQDSVEAKGITTLFSVSSKYVGKLPSLLAVKCTTMDSNIRLNHEAELN